PREIVNEVTVDVQEVEATTELGHDVRVPDLLHERTSGSLCFHHVRAPPRRRRETHRWTRCHPGRRSADHQAHTPARQLCPVGAPPLQSPGTRASSLPTESSPWGSPAGARGPTPFHAPA